MRHAMTLDVPQHFASVKRLHHYVCRPLRKQSKCHHARRMRKRRHAETHWIGSFTTPIMASHLNHRSPGEVRDAHTLRRTCRPTRGYQSHQAMRVTLRVTPFHFTEVSATCCKFHKRKIAITFGIDTNEILQCRHALSYVPDRFAKGAVVKHPRGFDI